MQLILDNLIAIIVAGVLLLGLQVTQVRSQHASIEQIASHSVKAKTLVFGQWVERDIMDIGANFGTNMYRFEAPTVDPATGNTTEWVFYSDTTATNGDQSRIFKRYRLVETELATFRDTTYQMYRVLRDSVVADFPDHDVPPLLEDIDDDDWVHNTRSIGTLSFFEVDLLGRDGQTPCPAGTEVLDDDGVVAACTGDIDVYKAEYVRVRFGVVPEYVLKPDNYLRELYWVKTLKVRPYWTPPPSLEN
jgi:hypothetical protein